MLFFLMESGYVCIIGGKCCGSELTIALGVTSFTIGTLVKKDTIARSIFFQVPLEA